MDFDRYAHKYDIELYKAIRLSGESKEYFARRRLIAARIEFARIGMKPRRIVEFGCGIGTNVGHIREFWPDSEIVGLDISEQSLTVAEERFGGAGVRFSTPDAFLSGDDARADWVLCAGVLHHIPVEERTGALVFLQGLLRPKGVLTLFDNNPFNPAERLAMRMVPFDRDAVMVNPYRLLKEVSALGFEQVTCRFLFIFPRFLALLRPLESSLERLPIGAQFGVFGVWNP